MHKSIEKYLKNFACPEVELARKLPRATLLSFVSGCKHFLVVPAYDEGENLDLLFASLSKIAIERRFCVVLVVNEKVSSDPGVKARHRAWMQKILENNFAYADAEHEKFLLGELDGIPTFVVNKTGQHAFEEKQGVGLARKIGSDLAVFFSSLASELPSFVFHTDADAVLPQNYFSAWEQVSPLDPKKTSLIVHRYRHVLPSKASKQQVFAMQAYEHYLHYYAENLKQAGSPYGIQTVGSCLGFSVLAYCQVRGFPKREAGEDFYLVNKLLKVGGVRESPSDPILLQGRVSYRVPFGTGASIGRISSYQKRSDYRIYSPKVFEVIRVLLHFAEQKLHGVESTLDLEATLTESVQESGFFKGLERAQNVSTSTTVRLKAFHDWFDGFKTLKLIHLLRDKHYPSVPAEDLLPNMS